EARVEVRGENLLALTLEKVMAGALPISPDQFVDKIGKGARKHALDIRWDRAGDLPVAVVHYTPDLRRTDLVLERLELSPRRNLHPRHDRRVQGPGPQGRPVLEHQVPVDPVPIVLQQDEAAHSSAPSIAPARLLGRPVPEPPGTLARLAGALDEAGLLPEH